MRTMAILLGAILALLGSAAVWLYVRQETLLFQPQHLEPDYAFGLAGVDEVRVPVDGAALAALHMKVPQPKGVVFYLHGNGGSLASWFVNHDFYRRLGFDLFMIDYRGYGKSGGTIRSEAQLRADARAAWDFVAPHYRGLRKVVFGRSLGSGLASRLAADVGADLTVLASPYWSMEEVSRVHYPLAPLFLLRYPLRSYEDVPRIAGPVLILHGDRDEVIPIGQAERLRDVARNAAFVKIAGAGHNDLQEFPAYLDAIAAALEKL